MQRLTVFLIAWTLSLLLVVPSIAEEKSDLETLREERDEKLERYFVRALTQKRLNIAFEYLDAGQHAATGATTGAPSAPTCTKAYGPGVIRTRPALTTIRPLRGFRWRKLHITYRRRTPNGP